MNSKVLSIVSMFMASVLIGYNLLPTNTLQAQPPVFPSVIELPSIARTIPQEVKKSVQEIDIEIDLSTNEVSVKGTTDAIVNVKTTNEPKPIVKYKTIVKEIEAKSTGYPYVNSVGKVPEGTAPISPLKTISSNHEQTELYYS